jgi:hypothetical protein
MALEALLNSEMVFYIVQLPSGGTATPSLTGTNLMGTGVYLSAGINLDWVVGRLFGFDRHHWMLYSALRRIQLFAGFWRD